MPLKQIEKILKMDSQKSSNNKKDEKHDKSSHRKNTNFVKKKDKFGRKRSQSFSGGVNTKFCPPYKCRKRPMLPTKFLLGGNICDPLNLNSLQDEEINRTVNAVTPKSSPLPTPPQRRGHIEVIIPSNIHDPLNLIDCADDAEYEQQLTSPLKKGSKRRKKKKRTSSATTEPSDADISSATEAKTPDVSLDSAKIPEIDNTTTLESEGGVGGGGGGVEIEVEKIMNIDIAGVGNSSPKDKLTKVTRDLKLELEKTPTKDKKRKSDSFKEVKKIRRFDSMDKIVSPVVPQPGAWRGPSNRAAHIRNNQQKNNKSAKNHSKLPQFKDKNKAYQYGNYNRYYGYRNPNHEIDARLRIFAGHRHIFIGKDILDIGCNIGHITLSVARDFGAKSVVGLDIDKKLIGIARKNVRHYVNCDDSPRADQERDQILKKHDKFFPISMPILYGLVDIPGMQNEATKGKDFPHNVNFVQGNYVLEDDTLLTAEQSQFDIILCLSITKWIHLNWGDPGLKQAFRRIYAQLRPGGKLILEPQSWASYKKVKTLTETIYKNYHTIEFFPEKFTQYLLSSEIGFAKSEIMGHPHHTSKGFQRPLQIFTKSDLSPSQSQRSYSATPSHTITSANTTTKVYTCLALPEEKFETSDNAAAANSSRSRSSSSDDKRIEISANTAKEVYTCLTVPDEQHEKMETIHSDGKIDNTTKVVGKSNKICDDVDDTGGSSICCDENAKTSETVVVGSVLRTKRKYEVDKVTDCTDNAAAAVIVPQKKCKLNEIDEISSNNLNSSSDTTSPSNRKNHSVNLHDEVIILKTRDIDNNITDNIKINNKTDCNEDKENCNAENEENECMLDNT